MTCKTIASWIHGLEGKHWGNEGVMRKSFPNGPRGVQTTVRLAWGGTGVILLQYHVNWG